MIGVSQRARWMVAARRILTRSLGVRFLVALALSTLVWGGVTWSRNPNVQVALNADIAVEDVNLGPNLVLASEIDTVRVTVDGPRVNIGNLNPRAITARVDLTGIGPGTHLVPVRVEVPDPAVEVVRVAPETVKILVDPFEVRAVQVTAQIEGAPAPGFRFDSNEVGAVPALVQLSGGASDVERVAEIVARVVVDQATRNVSTQALAVPTDRRGDEVANVQIEPQTVQVSVPVTRITSVKRVPVVAELQGEAAPGFFVRGIAVAPTTVEIEGRPEELELVTTIRTAPLDIAGAQADVEGQVAFVSPPGVSVFSDQAAAVVSVTVEPLIDTTTVQAAVLTLNVPTDALAVVSQGSVQIVIGGPVEVLRELRAGDVVAEVDVTGLAVGRHQVQPVITVPRGLDVTQVIPPLVSVDVQPAEAAPAAARPPPALIGPGGAVPSPAARPTPTPTPTSTPSARQAPDAET